jgi:hypothetical protein
MADPGLRGRAGDDLGPKLSARSPHFGRGFHDLGETDTFPWRALPAAGQAPRQVQSLVAIARSILVIVWHLLADRAARYRDLGAGYHATWIDKNRKMRTRQFPREPARTWPTSARTDQAR